MPEKRICKCGCGQEVPKDNRFAFINGHRKREGKSNTKKRAKKSAANGHAPVAVAPSPNGNGHANGHEVPRASLQVNEANDFLTRLPFETKQHLANYFLRNEAEL